MAKLKHIINRRYLYLSLAEKLLTFGIPDAAFKTTVVLVTILYAITMNFYIFLLIPIIIIIIQMLIKGDPYILKMLIKYIFFEKDIYDA